ncbi:hypothetical protein B0H14DRAFT_731564 [Mycena olivaceomarginata]|nr:hypothetical protein B0H14DRAFT_731564 [Mycena olivaceomarginata]
MRYRRGSTVPATPTGSTPRRREHKPKPHYQPHAQHATLVCLAAFPHIVTLQQCTGVTDRRLRLPYSPAPPSSPPARAARAMVVPHCRRRFCRLLARQARLQQVPFSPIHTRAGRAHPQHGTHHPPRAQHLWQPLPIAVPRLSPPCAPPPSPAPHHPPLDAGSCPAPGVRLHRRSAQQVQRAFPVPHAAFIVSPRAAPVLYAHAALRSKPQPAAHHEHDGHHPPYTQHRLQLSPHHLIPSPLPRPSSALYAPLVDDSARRLPITSAGCICRDDSATGWRGTDHTEAMRTPCFHRYPLSALGIPHKRGWGTATSLGATNPGGDRPTLPRHFGSHRRLCNLDLRRAL